MKRIALLLLAGMLFAGAPAVAQTPATVKLCVPTSATACPPVTSAAPLPVTATFTPSGTQNVNVTQILGAAPSLTNPLWVSPATGATFPVSASSLPTGATAITISATGTTGAVAAALAAASAKSTYICGFSITSDAIAGLSGNATVAGIVTGTMTYIQGVGVAPAVASTTQNFNPCIPSSTTNTAVTVTSAAAGTGGTTAVNAWGYQQ